MASYLDKSVSFNPYVQQLPVESMVSVGMQKQKMYDEGVEKIQSSIDNIAGLDLARDVDKNYLQTKLNSLNQNLKMVAAGDFSNRQLVNSVAGMTTQIGKDPIIQTAVTATARYRKQLEEIQKAKSEGKSSPQNEGWFSKGTNDWFNNPKAGTPFTEEYTPYTDLTKKWIEIQKDLGVTDITTDLPFLQDNQGRYIDKSGNLTDKPVPNDAMIEKISKGKSPQAIKNAIMASMNETDIKQLKIDGWYHYKDMPVSSLVQLATSKHTDYIQKQDNYIDVLKTQKSLHPGNSQYQDYLQKEIDAVIADEVNSGQQYMSTMKSIQTNPEQFKSELYSQHAINDFAVGFSNYNESVIYKNNPYKEQEDKNRDYSLAVDRYKLENWSAHDTSTRAWKGLGIQEEELALKKQTHLQETTLFQPGMATQNIPTGVTPPTSQSIVDGIADNKQALIAIKNKFRHTQMEKGMTDQEFGAQYALHQKAYNDGIETEAKWVTLFDTISEGQRSIDNSSHLIGEIQHQADQKYGRVESKDKTKWINQQLSEKAVNYQARSIQFNEKMTPQIKNAYTQFINRIETDGGKQESDPMTKNHWDLATTKSLLANPETKYGVIIQGKNIYLTMQGGTEAKPLPLQMIKTDNDEFSQVFGQSVIAPSQGAADLMVQSGNTNPQSNFQGSTLINHPEANSTAYFTKIRGGSMRDAFPNVINHDIKADIMEISDGKYQLLFYVYNPLKQRWETKTKNDFVSYDLNALFKVPYSMSDKSIEKL